MVGDAEPQWSIVLQEIGELRIRHVQGIALHIQATRMLILCEVRQRWIDRQLMKVIYAGCRQVIGFEGRHSEVRLCERGHIGERCTLWVSKFVRRWYSLHSCQVQLVVQGAIGAINAHPVNVIRITMQNWLHHGGLHWIGQHIDARAACYTVRRIGKVEVWLTLARTCWVIGRMKSVHSTPCANVIVVTMLDYDSHRGPCQRAMPRSPRISVLPALLQMKQSVYRQYRPHP